MNGSKPDDAVLEQTRRFYVDASLCGTSAIALKTNAPAVLAREALRYAVNDPTKGATFLGSSTLVMPEKAALVNGAAVREWDSNGTNFGYVPSLLSVSPLLSLSLCVCVYCGYDAQPYNCAIGEGT